MATKKGKSRTAAANAARRKQGPTKQTDYKNGRPVTAAAKKKAGGKSKGGASGGSGSSGSAVGRKSSTNPGSTGSKSEYMRKDAAARSKRLEKEISSLQRERSMTTGHMQRTSLAQKISQKSQQKRLNDDIASGRRDATGAEIKAKKPRRPTPKDPLGLRPGGSKKGSDMDRVKSKLADIRARKKTYSRIKNSIF